MKHSLQLLILVFIILFLTGCGTINIPTTNYYILEYKNSSENPDLKQKQKLNYVVNVQDAKVSGSYYRNQIVMRTSDNQITYMDYDLWASKLSTTVPDLISTRANRYNFFSRCSRNYDEKSDYEILTTISNLEMINYSGKRSAHVYMEIALHRLSDNRIVVVHSFNKSKELYDDNMANFVFAINEIIMTETDNFFKKTLNHLVSAKDEANPITQDLLTQEDNEITYQASEDTTNTNMGSLYLPALTNSELEPTYTIFNPSTNETNTDYKMGQEVSLLPGTYTIYYGSAPQSEQMFKLIDIRPGSKTIMTPDWGCLRINVFNEIREQIDYRYEIFYLDSKDRISIGYGSGVNEGLGQELSTWVLKPGLYKIVINNYPSQTYIDFATVEVKKGMVEEFAIVVNSVTKNLIGAGNIKFQGLGSNKNKKRNSLAINVNGNLSSSNETNKTKNVTIMTLNLQLDHRYIYDVKPFYITSKSMVETGITKESQISPHVSTDVFDSKNTGVVYLLKDIAGLYTRLDFNTHFLNEYIHTTDERKYIKTYTDNTQNTTYTKDFKIKDALYPLTFKEGTGVNFRPLNNHFIVLNLRGGIGFRQVLNNNTFNKVTEVTDSLGTVYYYSELSSIKEKGWEMSLVSNGQVGWLNYIVNGDVLLPFTDKNSTTYELESIFNLRLPGLPGLSLDYRLNADYNKKNKDYVVLDHSFYLRYSYMFSF